MSKCPWCGSTAKTLRTLDHLDEAEFVYTDRSEAAARRNPVMCSECHGVGGYEDFVEVAA